MSAGNRIELFISRGTREYFPDFPNENEIIVSPQTSVAQIVGKTPESQKNEFIILLNGKNASLNDVVQNGDKLSILMLLMGG
jgi:sulfur carrier protein ThiS